MANKIGCSTGRVTVIDPNDFNGYNSQSNMSVPLEDLNISVILKTFRKGRTVLSKTADGGSRESSQTVSVNFIEGTNIDGSKKVLTTKYTDLTTVFEAGTINSETLGITNIDIDFNPSMAPMVTINFIDVRGSSIFQNEQNISGNNSGNKYGVFFQLPYPLFELEVKGYYGKPVTYCLHMLKFNAKFNSQTGNFEIQCQFVGYTYAMLSDLLIGYLKAIPYTDIGKDKYEEYNKTRTTPILNLNELMKAISDINQGVKKLAASSDSAKSVNTTDEALESLDRLKGVVNSLGARLDINNTEEKTEYTFILVATNKPQTEIDSAITHYKDTIKTNIEEFNTLATGVATLKESDFNDVITTGKDQGLYSNIKKSDLSLTATTIDSTLTNQTGSGDSKDKFKRELLAFINRYYAGNGEDFTFNVYNMTAIIEKINRARVDMEATQDQAKKTLANDLRATFREELGFEPTVRNIVEIFTVAIEVMMETIYSVSTAAEDPKNTERNGELESKFTNNLVTDVKSNKLNSETNKFYAWPDYKEKDETTKTYVNKYLGTPGVLEAPYKVNELAFIDNLLAAFIKAQKAANEVEANADAEVSTWYPTNPFDTKLFVDKEPYERYEMKSDADVVRMMIIRAMTFLGYTNIDEMFDAENKEIMAMAEMEVDAILRVVKNEQLIQSLTQLTPKFITEMTISTGANFDPLLKVIGTDYVYNYPNAIGTDNNTDAQIIIPMNQDFGGFWPTFESKTDLKKRFDAGAIFLSNYSNQYRTNWKDKVDDGAQYVKILKMSEYDTNVALYPAPAGLKADNIFDYSKMSAKVVDPSAGYNSFGGTLGIQEYINMDYGKQELANLPMMYSFYAESTYTGLAYNRKDSGVIQGTYKNASTDSNYDFNKDKIHTIESAVDAYKSKTDTFKVHAGLGKNWELFNKFKQNIPVSYPYIEQRYISFSENIIHDPYSEYKFSLFGSKWYYYQQYAKVTQYDGTKINAENYAKAILFLQTMPFNYRYDKDSYIGPLRNGDPFNTWMIRHMFNEKGGFIHAPRLWCAHLGAILWYMDNSDAIVEDGKIVGGGSGNSWPINWNRSQSAAFEVPVKGHKGEYFPPVLDVSYDVSIFVEGYPNVQDEDIVRNLPMQVVEEFKKVFLDFVNGTDEEYVSFKSIRDSLEIWKDGASAIEFQNKLDLVFAGQGTSNGVDYFSPTQLTNDNRFRNLDNYEIISIVDDIQHYDYYFLELKGDTATNPAVKNLVTALTEEMVIANATYKIWRTDAASDSPLYQGVRAPKDKFELYFSTVIATLKAKADKFSPNEVKKQIEQQIFGTTDENLIKLILYNTCKNIHDKWLAGVTDPNNVIFQCGDSSGKPFRNKSDDELAKKYGNSKTRLIDSFRFVSRSFKDIGDKLFINPIPINDYLIESPNTSAYNAISGLLDSNKFTFDALPTFINFRDPDNVAAIFEPMPNYEEAIQNGSCGPSFVCVYAGQTSKHLDFANSDYENDGFDFDCNNGDVATSAPDDFTEDIGGGEDPVAVFKVVYGQQNQNIFKDINLDQSEFTETDESLQIQDQISQQGAETNRSLVGQNIYNVYAVRSYSAEIEMMGDAMIQPMMYFQLDNIPMFHGAYMVTRVKHNIKPNYMSTNFTGVRIRHAETPLVTAMDLFMSMVDTLDTGEAGTGEITTGSGGVAAKGSLAPIVRTIVENGGLNGNIANGNIYYRSIPKITGINNLKLNNQAENRMLFNAVDPLVKMLTAWVAWMKTEGFAGSGGNYASITSVFRDYDKQVAVKKEYGDAAATPGTSPHGWGIAVDLQFYRKDGSLISNTKNTSSAFDVQKNPAIKWLYDNSYVYGFVLPYSLRDKAGLEEHWHFEYHGTAAKCLISKNPTIYGYTVKVDKNQDAVVQNPEGKDGKRAVYTDCDYKAVKDSGDGVETVLGGNADYWSLVAICALENYADNPQGMADVAQSIYNRLNTPNKPYGKTIKEIVTASGQYEPTFKNRNQWLLIKDEKSAITAVKNSKGWTDDKAKERLNTTKAAIANTTYQNNAKTFVNTRTEFLASNPSSSKAIDVVSRTPKDTNNSFYWEYAGKALKGQAVPNPPDFSKLT